MSLITTKNGDKINTELLTKVDSLGGGVYNIYNEGELLYPNVILTTGERLQLQKKAKMNSSRIEDASLLVPENEEEAVDLENFRKKIAGHQYKTSFTQVRLKNPALSPSWVSDHDMSTMVARGYTPCYIQDVANPEVLLNIRPGEHSKNSGVIQHNELTLMKINKKYLKIIYQETVREQNSHLNQLRREFEQNR